MSSSHSQPRQAIVPTPLAAIDDPLTKDLMMSSPTYRAAATTSTTTTATTTTTSGNGSPSSPTNGGASPGSVAAAAATGRGMRNARHWKPAPDRRLSFDPQVYKHNLQRQQQVAGVGTETKGFTEKA